MKTVMEVLDTKPDDAREPASQGVTGPLRCVRCGANIPEGDSLLSDNQVLCDECSHIRGRLRTRQNVSYGPFAF